MADRSDVVNLPSLCREHRDLAYIQRWSIMRLHHRQSVAEHCFYVALYATDLARWTCGDVLSGDDHQFIARIARFALWHDVEEAWTGDIPGPAKRLLSIKQYSSDGYFQERFGFQKERPTEHEQCILDAAGAIDECMFLAGEMLTGNQSVAAVYQRSAEKLRKLLVRVFNLHDPQQTAVYDEILRAITMERVEPCGILTLD